jgi:hypothetical protein
MDELVPGRECGPCNLCCVAPVIDSPELTKRSGAVCRHSHGGCDIYDSRPDVCRRFFCAWRRTKLIPQDWRPDRCGVFATLDSDNVPPQFGGAAGISLMLTDNPLKTVRQPWFLDFVAGAVADRVPLFLTLPGPQGAQAAMVLLNDAEMEAAARQARAAVKAVLERVLKRLAAHQFVSYEMAHDGADVSS